jgi:ferredoxin
MGAEPDENQKLSAVGGGAGIKVQVDHDMCSGTRNCERQYGEIFTVERSKAWVRGDVDWSKADVERLRMVETACPWAAIEIDSGSPG